MIAGGNRWRANEIVIGHLIRQTATRYLAVTEPAADFITSTDVNGETLVTLLDPAQNHQLASPLT